MAEADGWGERERKRAGERGGVQDMEKKRERWEKGAARGGLRVRRDAASVKIEAVGKGERNGRRKRVNLGERRRCRVRKEGDTQQMTRTK